jgi:hypothetical protein
MIIEAKRRHNETAAALPQIQHVVEEAKPSRPLNGRGVVRVDEEQGWSKQTIGAAALVGCAGIWAAGSWLESL